MGQECFEPMENAEQEQDLDCQQHKDQPGTAEDHTEDPPLAFFQQAQAGVLGIIFHGVLLSQGDNQQSVAQLEFYYLCIV